MSEKKFIGIDIGGTKILAGLITSHGDVLKREKLSLPKKAGSKEIFESVEKLIDGFQKELKKKENISGIGIGIPGILDGKREKIIESPNLDIKGLSLAKELSKKFKIPVKMENDVNAGLLGEKWLGAAKCSNNVIGIFPGTGVGGGILVNGEIYAGSNGAAAELGHLIIKSGGEKCGCKNNGCLESYSSRSALEREINKLLKKGRKSVVSKMLNGETSTIKSGILKKALKKKDPVVKKVVAEAAKDLAGACLSFRHIFDPELFVFGGGLIEACGDFILPVIRSELKNDPFFGSLPECKVVEATLGDDAVMLGAVALYLGNSRIKEFAEKDEIKRVLLVDEKEVRINGDVLKNDFYLRSDGKVKLLKIQKGDFTIGLKEIKKVCKKKVQVLFHGYALNKRIEFKEEALKHLKDKSIQLVLKPLSSIQKIYNESDKRKALLVTFA